MARAVISVPSSSSSPAAPILQAPSARQEALVMFRSEPPLEVGRRRLITAAGAGLLATALAACGGEETPAKTTAKTVVADRNEDTEPTWQEARQRLEEGNARFLEGRS